MPLAEGALTLALEERPDLPVRRYLDQLDEWAERVDRRSAEGLDIVQALHQVLFDELGFDGNRDDYYRPENSLMHRVMEARTGLPLSLSVVYVEVARRVGLIVDGVSFPGHFLVRIDVSGRPVFVDPFHRGQRHRAEELPALLEQVLGQHAPVEPWMTRPTSATPILLRMLGNLKFAYTRRGQLPEAITVLDRMLSLRPGEPEYLHERGYAFAKLGLYQAAVRDLEEVLPSVSGLQAHRLQMLIPQLRASTSSLS